MLRAFWFAIKIGLLVAVATWLVSSPGEMTFDWRGYHIRMDAGLALVSGLFFLLVLFALYRLLIYILQLPDLWVRYRVRVRKGKGEKALLRGLGSLAAGDADLAFYQAKRARRFLPRDQGLTLLLEGQAARLQGDEDTARKAFTTLLKHKDTAFLGLRGLLVSALDKGDYDLAEKLVQKAIRMHPKQPWVIQVAYNLSLRRADWQRAEELLARAEKYKALPADAAQNDRSVLLIKQAENDIAEGHDRQALRKLKKAHKNNPSFIPAALRLAQFRCDRGQTKQARKVIEKTWKIQPHPDLVSLWRQSIPEKDREDSRAAMRWMEKLVSWDPDSALGQIAAAEMAISLRLWEPARQYLQRAETLSPSARLYRTWARLEEAQGHAEAANVFFEKAGEAPADKVWTCRKTGRIYDRWVPVAEPHGSFNTIVWGYPQAEEDETKLLTKTDLMIMP